MLRRLVSNELRRPFVGSIKRQKHCRTRVQTLSEISTALEQAGFNFTEENSESSVFAAIPTYPEQILDRLVCDKIVAAAPKRVQKVMKGLLEGVSLREQLHIKVGEGYILKKGKKVRTPKLQKTYAEFHKFCLKVREHPEEFFGAETSHEKT
jgi:hypothetical protein